MTQVTEDSSVQIRNPVANRADYDSHKFKGTFGWATDQVAPVFCPADGADFVRLSVHPDEAPDAGTLNSGDTILVSVGGTLKKTTVLAIGGGGTWQPLDQDLTDIAALTTQAFGRSLLTRVDAAAVRTLIGAPAVADLAGYQPLDGDLTAISGLATDAFGRSLLTQTSAANVRSLIGAGTSSFSGAYTSLSAIPAAIDALDNLTPAADRLPYFTNGTTAALATFSAFARTLLDDADAAAARTTLGAGTVSSVTMTVPSGFSVSGSPITGSGTLAVTLSSQTADKVLASPSGASGVPSFIALSASHIPSLPWSKITTGLPTTLAGYGIADAQAKDADLTAIAALTTTGFLQRTGPDTWTLVAAPTPAAHEASHRAGGSDALLLTNISGGRITDAPQFAGLTLTGDLVVQQDTSIRSNSADGNEQTAVTLAGGGAGGPTRGAYVVARGNERPTSGGTLTLAAGDGLQGIVEVATGGTVRMTVTKAGEVNVSSGTLRVGSFGGLAAFTGGLFRQAVNGDFPGPLSTMAGLANARGFMYNSGSGTLSWAVAIPGESFTTLGVTHFGGTGVSAGAWQIGSNNGVGFGDSRGLNWRGGMFNSDAFWGLAQDAGATTSFKPMVFKDGTGATWYKLDTQDASFKHYFTGNLRVTGDADITGDIKQGGATAIGSSRTGYLTALQLSNMSNGQIPVVNSSQFLVASGMTDDGTFLGISRTIRAWNSIARSGNTWTDLQWTQLAEERVSILSSDTTGAGGYHTLAMVPHDTDTTGRRLGGMNWAQKVAGKSGTVPGLKAVLSAKTMGAGGTVGGFGGQVTFEYRSDNGSALVEALRIGAFGGSTADAVEAAILLRANAGLRVTALTAELVKSNSTGVLSNATANTDYLPVNNPVSTGAFKANVTQHTARTYVGGARTIDPGLTPKFQRQTGAGTITLPTATASYEGLEYKITFHGRFNVTFDTPSGEIYTLAAGASYWYGVASTTVSAGDASGENCACDVWCDGSNWYIRW